MEPAFVCSCQDISSAHTTAATSTTTTTVPKDQEGGGLHRPSTISPARISPTLSPPSFLFPVYSPSLVCKTMLYRSRTEVIAQNKSMKYGKDKLNFSPSICSPLSVRTPLSSLFHPPSISFSPSPSLWWRVVIPLGSIFQASEHPFTAAITNL